MEPITAGLLYAAVAVGVATTRPRWEFCTGGSQLELVHGLGQAEANYLPLYQFAESNFPSRAERIISELEGYALLRDGWNGETSVRPSLDAIREAQAFIESIPPGLPLPSPTISYDGEIGFYWNSEFGYIDIQLDAPGQASLYSRSRVTGQEYFEESIDWPHLDRRWYGEKLGALSAPLLQAA